MFSAQSHADHGRYLIKGGHVLTMASDTGNLPGCDVLIEDGCIAKVGQGLAARDAEVIDAADMIVMPGFVEVHWHMWNCIWRGLSHDAPGYFGLHRLAPDHSSEDHYNALRLAAVEGLSAGVTTCHNWANALRGREDAVAEARALVETGIRARFGYGTLMPQDDSARAADLAAMRDWIAEHGKGLLDLGIVCHHQDSFESDVVLARGMGLKSIAPHVNPAGGIHLLGPDFIFTHGPGTPDFVLAILKEKRVKVGLCPSTDPLIGAGLPPLLSFLNAGIPFEDIGFSVDVSAQTSVDPFTAMRTIMHSARIAQKKGASFDDIIISVLNPTGTPDPLTMPKEMLELATINGARVLGIDDQVGSIVPGKRADIIMLRTDDLNMLSTPHADPAFLVVQHGQPHNVDTVFVDGRLLKRSGRFTQLDVREVARRAADSQRRLWAGSQAAAR